MQNSKICWLVGKAPLRSRYQTIEPGQAGHNACLELGRFDAAALAQACDGAAPDIVILAAAMQPEAQQALAWARSLGARVVVDFPDDAVPTGAQLRQLTGQADAISVASPGLAALVRAETGRDAFLVNDPCEGAREAPRFSPGERLRVAWYGDLADLAEVSQLMTELMQYAIRRPLGLEIVLGAQPQLAASLQRAEQITGGRLQVKISEDGPAARLAAIRDCDMVILPQSGDSAAQLKGAGRLVAAIHGGRLAVAGPLPGYRPFGAGAWLEGRIADGLDWALANPAAALQRIAAGQTLIEASHAPAAVASQWQAAFAAAQSGAVAAPAVVTRSEIRLNLGCGDKILPGYVNCDALPARGKGPAVDVQCDVTKPLPFADASVGEILAVHVIEHIWRWEVADVLRDWRRVLQPGGKIVLECPNLISACMELLKNPVPAAGPGPEGQRSMWVFYGDPRWKDPLMIHRWGYTPQSLGALLMETGFVDVRQEPAQFKLREPRDMRIVGVRPA